MSHQSHSHKHDFLLQDKKISSNEKKIFWVIILTFITMIAEIYYGYTTGSMALLADGWHMGSHVGALGISYFTYRLARSKKLGEHFSFGTGKFVPLGGYTSAIMLGAVAVFMAVESVERFLNPVSISFNSALVVAVIGLIVNLISAIILWDNHNHDHHTHDHNHKSALIHVIADALTSVAAILALVFAKYFSLHWMDPIMGIIGSIIILQWAFGLLKETAWELLDGHSKTVKPDDIKNLFQEDHNIEITDLHIWRIAPNANACEMVVYNNLPKGSEYYRGIILQKFNLEHLIIEERTCQH